MAVNEISILPIFRVVRLRVESNVHFWSYMTRLVDRKVRHGIQCWIDNWIHDCLGVVGSDDRKRGRRLITDEERTEEEDGSKADDEEQRS